MARQTGHPWRVAARRPRHVRRFLLARALLSAFAGFGVVVAGGQATLDDRVAPIVIRYTGHGSPDTSFGRLGATTTTFLNGNSPDQSVVAIGVDANLRVTALCNTLKSGHNETFVVRFNNNGSVDETYGTSGFVGPVGQSEMSAVAMRLLSDNRAVLVGKAVAPDANGNLRPTIARLSPSGAVEFARTLSSTNLEFARDLAVDAKGPRRHRRR